MTHRLHPHPHPPLEGEGVYARIDGLEKVTGAAKYASDISRPGMLHGKVLRSPVAHARIRSVDVRRARELAGVRAVLTSADLPDCRVGRSMRDMPVLARERVRFIGEKVAAVAAEDPEIADEALRLIEVDYEELPAVFDPIEAMQPGAPLIHDPALVHAWATPRQRVADYPNSVSAPVWGASVEEVQVALARAPHVFEHTFRTPVQHQGYLEPHACIVKLDDEGVAHIWASNKAPFLLLNYLREGLGLQREQVEIHMLPLGGDFGGKGSFMDIPLVYFLAKATGRPVKMVMTYGEELMAANPRHSAVITVRSGFDDAGRLLARWTTSVYNSGAYAAFKPALDATLPRVLYGGRGAYPEVPVWCVEGHMVYTNTVPCGHMRAPGGAQPGHAIECHMDLCARAMGMDPLELRLINAPRERGLGVGGQGSASSPQSPTRAREALRAAADAIRWGQPKPQGVGRGIALTDVMTSAADAYSARMVVQRDGRVVFETPIIEQGSGMLTAFRLLAAEAFGIPPDQVEVRQTMEGIDYDRGVGGSRVTRIVGKMIAMQAAELKGRLRELVAAEFGHPVAEVALEPDGFRTPDGLRLSLAEASSLASADLEHLLRYQVEPGDVVDTYGAIAAEVHLDPETGQMTVKRVVIALERGQIVNPVMYQGQIDGGLLQGLGYALTEGLVFDDGRVTNLNLHEYKLPVTADIPELQTILLEPDLSLGITPIGEGPNVGISAAIACAVMAVLGRQVEIPIAAEALTNSPVS